MTRWWCALVLMAIASVVLVRPFAAAAESFQQTTLFRGGEDGYHTYRIPAVIRAADGSILAFAEGRKDNGKDSGEINLVLKRSTDGGATFSPQQVVWADGPNTCGNPCPVVDESTSTISLLATHNLGDDVEKQILGGTAKGSRTVWVLSSEDNGKTWSTPREITTDVKKSTWNWYATGPGIGVQLKHGAHVGRLVVPCDYSLAPHAGNAAEGGGSNFIYSDDHGKTWKLGGITQRQAFNECQAVELSDGRLMLNMRILQLGEGKALPKVRGVAISDDGGESFSSERLDETLIDPRCQASILRFTWPEQRRSRILFSNVANAKERKGLAVRLSYDEGQTWAVTKPINSTWAAYSSLVKLDENRVGLLYETGDVKNYERIDWAKFDVGWLTGEKDLGAADRAGGAARGETIDWKPLPDLPETRGLAGAFAGQWRDSVLFAGGSNFPDAPPWRGGQKHFSSEIYLLRASGARKLVWTRSTTSMPRALAYGVSINTDRGVVLIGGCDAARCSADVVRATWDTSGEVKFEKLPPLPHPLAFATGALLDNVIYIAGGQATIDRAEASAQVFALDLSKEGSADFAWRELPALPSPRVLALAAVIEQGPARGVYVFSGRNVQPGKPTELVADAFRYDPQSRGWETLPPIRPGDGEPLCMMAGSAIATRAGKILLLGGDSGEAFRQAEQLRAQIDRTPDSREQQSLRDQLIDLSEHHPGFDGRVVEFDPVARSYRAIGNLPQPAPVTAGCVPWNDDAVLLLSGEIRAGVRSPKCWLGTLSNGS